jgi:hypothetical protein
MRFLSVLFAVLSTVPSSVTFASDSCPTGCSQISGTLPLNSHSLPTPNSIVNRFIENARNDRKNRPEIIYQVKITIHHVGDGENETAIAHATRTIGRDGSIKWGKPSWDSSPRAVVQASLSKFTDGEANSSQMAVAAHAANQDPPAAITCDNYNFEFKNVVTDSNGHIRGYSFHVTPRNDVFSQAKDKTLFVKEDIVIDASAFREASAQGSPVQERPNLSNSSYSRNFTFQGDLRLDQHHILNSTASPGGLKGKLLDMIHGDGAWTFDLEFSTPQINR